MKRFHCIVINSASLSPSDVIVIAEVIDFVGLDVFIVSGSSHWLKARVIRRFIACCIDG